MRINFFQPLQFTTFMGPQGRRWSAGSSHWEHLFDHCTEAVFLMRKHRLDEGKEKLDQVQAELPLVESPLLRRVLDRFYHGSIGYYAYLLGDYEWADAAMAAGCDAIADAVENASFLMPFAHHCQELVTHRARIDRNRRNWPGMLRYIELGRAMIYSEAPLCTLSDGTEITYHTLGEVFAQLVDLSDDERRQIDELLDQERRGRVYTSFTRGFMDPPGFVIPTAA